MAHNRLSKAGRKACSATGVKDLEEWRTRREKGIAERTALADAFRTELLAEIGPNPSTAAKVLTESAVASHLAISTLMRRFVMGRSGPWQLDQLTRMQGQLNRTLRLLGVRFPSGNDNSDDPSKPVRGGIADYLAGRVPAAPAPDTGGDNNG